MLERESERLLVSLSEATGRSGAKWLFDLFFGLGAVVDAYDTDTVATWLIVFVAAHGILAVVAVLIIVVAVVAIRAGANHVGRWVLYRAT